MIDLETAPAVLPMSLPRSAYKNWFRRRKKLQLGRRLYRAFWWCILDHDKERVWLKIEQLSWSWSDKPPSAEELKVWRKRAARYNLVFNNVNRSDVKREKI